MEISFIKIKHGDDTFYLCAFDGDTLSQITYVARRGENEEEGAIQRILNKKRITGIKDFLLNGGFFPNNIILNLVKLDNFVIDEAKQKITLTIDARIAQIIDGQHRVEGLKEAIKANSDLGKLKVPTVLAVNLTTSKCAEIFININTEQKTVPKSLIYDLYGLLSISNRDFSVDRGTDIANILNTDEKSAYQGYIKFPGSRKFKGGIQLSTFVSNLKQLVKTDGEFSKYSITTLEIQASILMNYINTLQFYYGKEWDSLKNPFLFASGFGAAIEVFITKILPYGYSQKKYSETFFKEILIMPKDKIFYQDEVKGLSGEAARENIKIKLNSCLSIIETNEEEFEI
jgi:DNA sulfur modification protein DndB